MKINADAMANSPDELVVGPAVLDVDDMHRYVYAINVLSTCSTDLVFYISLIVHSDDRSHVYPVGTDSDLDLKIDLENNVVEYTSGGKQYRIRELQASDKSWLTLPSRASTSEKTETKK